MKTKKLILLTIGLLLCATQGFATQYCGDVAIANTNGDDYKIYVNVSESNGTYTIEVTSACSTPISGLNGDNMFCYINGGTTTTYHMAASGHYSLSNGKVTFTVPSTAAPKIYTDLAFSFNGNNRTFSALKNIELEACSGGGGGGGDTPTGTSTYCNQEMTADGHTINLTNTMNGSLYRFTITSADVMTGIYDGTYCYRNGQETYQMKNAATVSNDGLTIAIDITSTTPPKLYTNLMVNFKTGTNLAQYTDPNGKTLVFGTCGSPVPVTGVTLDQSTATLYLGGSDASKTTTLVSTISPGDASDKTVSWSSSDDKVATVNGGVVTAVGKGSANIIVTTKDGNKTCTCAVTVKQYVTSIVLNQSSMTLKKDAQETLTAQVSPDNADNKSITWSSSNDAIATVSNGVVTAKSSGTATITATANDGSGVKATCTVTVPIPVTGVSLNKTATSLYVDGQETLTAIVEPDNATDKTVTWSSSNESVATVVDGVVTAVADGTATITAKSNDDNTKLATCIVTVSTYVAPVYVAQTTITDSKTSANYTMNYSIVYNLNGTLTYTITLDGYLKDLNPQIHVKVGGEVVQLSGYTSEHLSATGTTTNVYTKDEQQTGQFYLAYADGGLIQQGFSYTVGADNTSCGTCFPVKF